MQAAGRTRPHHVDYSFERPLSLIVVPDSSRASHRIATMVSRCRAFAMTCTFRLPVGLWILSRNPRTAATHVPYDVLLNFYDSPAPVRQRYLAGADAKGSYVASRLIGLGCSIRCSRAGVAHRPRFSLLFFSAKPERNAFKTVGFRHVHYLVRRLKMVVASDSLSFPSTSLQLLDIPPLTWRQ